MKTLPTAHTSIEGLMHHWQSDPTIAGNIAHAHIIPARQPAYRPIPESLHAALRTVLDAAGISYLYSHQQQAVSLIQSGYHIAVVTGTASGKTLCYNLPVIDTCLRSKDARALYIFPTKALTQDQQGKLNDWLNPLDGAEGLSSAIYDGDTPSAHRGAIRSKARILLSNPDMLHTGILPHHTLWTEFFRNLRFVVIDEIHMYRGVFGSHLANLIRRLQRIAAFYGSYPQFILTSATIANPRDLAERLIEQPVKLIDEDGSPSGEKTFLLYNPPVINPALGLRASSLLESQRLLSDLLAYHVQSIAFTITRRSVELLLKYLRENHPDIAGLVEGYRSGYLPNERRAIERNLREGITRCVIATNALELGIDIGSIDAAVIVGYPGSIASTRQQAGRAGRKTASSLAVLVASASPIDQYLVRHPEYLFDSNPEQALIDPDNLLILLQHLRCAAFELPFRKGDPFGRVDKILLDGLLSALTQTGEVHSARGRFFWTADQYPASQVSLRSSSPDSVKLQAEIEGRVQIIGIVDRPSALWMVHPQAVYLHGGQSYLVEDLDLENHIAQLQRKEVDFYTEPLRNTTVEKIADIQNNDIPGGSKNYGEIKVTTQVTGFRKVRWYTRENLGEGQLDLPPSELITNGYWIALNSETVDTLRRMGLWSNDSNNYGPGWGSLRMAIRARDQFTCQVCGTPEMGKAHHVHHKIPFRQFLSIQEANRPDNLITLCPNCHQLAETNIRLRSGLAGFTYALHNLAPLFLMCDVGDLGAHYEPQSPLANGQPVTVIYDMVPAGIGLSQKLFEIDETVIKEALSLVSQCECPDGCPSCVGPAGENGVGGKAEALAIITALTGQKMILIEE
jgi:DEAD/DEAH box helicase domain-containing protein